MGGFLCVSLVWVFFFGFFFFAYLLYKSDQEEDLVLISFRKCMEED